MNNNFCVLTGMVLSAAATLAVGGEAQSGKESGLEAKVQALEKRVEELEREQAASRRDPGFPNRPGGRMSVPQDFEELLEQMRGMELGPNRNFDSRDFGAAPKPRLGVELAAPTDELRERFKNSAAGGAFVMSVIPNSPAEKSGLSVGDSVTEFNGKAVASPRDLIEAVRAAPKGKNDMTVVRRGESLVLKIELGEPGREDEGPADMQRAPGTRQRDGRDGWMRRGDAGGKNDTVRSQMEIKASAFEMNENLAKELKLNTEQRGKMSDVLARHAKMLNEDAAAKSATGGGSQGGAFNFNVTGDVAGLVEKHAQEAEKELAGILSGEQIKAWGDYRSKNTSLSVSHSMVIENNSSGPGADQATGF